MSANVRLTLPRWHQDAVQSLLDIEDDQHQNLVTTLAATAPTMSRTRFAREVSNSSGLRFNEVDQLVSLLVSLYTVRANLNITIPDFVEAFRDVVQEGVEEQRIAGTDQQIARIPDRLAPLLELEETVGVLSKAGYLWSQHENVFSDAQILTDIRPVFRSDAREPPAAAVITHKLRITYSTPEEHQSRDIFIALDTADLGLLRRAINRAEEKSKTLATVLKPTMMRLLEEVTSDNRDS